jgi:hypothetical protein
MLILCLLPVSTLAQPTVPNVVANIPRSAAAPSGEIPDDHHEVSSFQLEDAQLHLEVEAEPNGGLLLPRTSTSDMPTPFDTVSNNFANATCVSFFKKFLSNTTVTDCHAVSLLLENSNSFFHTLASAAATSRVLNTACSQPLSKCASIMTDLAEQMLQEDNCGQDYESNNSVVQGTYQDLVAYKPIYLATCFTNAATKNYCLVDAVKNTTAPNDYNVYFMPLGSVMGSGRLTCGQCLRDTVNIFAHWATVDGQALDTTYLPSARTINEICGAGFANTNVTVGRYDVTSGAGLTILLPGIRLVASVLGLALGAISTGMF